MAAQTVACAHLVEADDQREGPSIIRNRLASAADTEWLLPLDDDDTIDPTCVERLLAAGSADIVYPWCRTDPHDAPMSAIINKLFTPDALFKMNYIPVTVLIRRDAYQLLGGYRKVQLEDWDLLQRAWLHDLQFKCVPEVLWTYNFHGANHFQGVQ